jgi:hypothetical protein
MSPVTLAQHLMATAEDRVRWKLAGEFLEEYRWEPAEVQVGLTRDEPQAVGDERRGVLLAALAEHLHARDDLAPPAWAELRVLRRPWFPAPLASSARTRWYEHRLRCASTASTCPPTI